MNVFKRIYKNLKTYGLKKTIINKTRIYLNFFFLLVSSKKKIYFPDKKKFKKISIDTSDYYSDMCDKSLKYNTDKSPYNQKNFRHAYTGIYNFLFDKIKNESLNICELGILQNESIKLLRDYFPNSNIYAFDNEISLINKAKRDNLKNVNYNLIDVKDSASLLNTFSSITEKFDIMIDDSTHVFEDQIRIIKNLHRFMKPGGIMVIEDIYDENDEKDYFLSMREIEKYFQDIFFIETKHKNIFTPLHNNNKILILKK